MCRPSFPVSVARLAMFPLDSGPVSFFALRPVWLFFIRKGFAFAVVLASVCRFQERLSHRR